MVNDRSFMANINLGYISLFASYFVGAILYDINLYVYDNVLFSFRYFRCNCDCVSDSHVGDFNRNSYNYLELDLEIKTETQRYSFVQMS